MNECPTCGKHLEPTVRFCPDDGTPMSETAAATGARTPTSQNATVKVALTLPVVVGNRYKLTEMRGGGGMAKVYRATDTTLERVVAVKLINAELRNDPEFDARFQREARIASQLADPHIVVVHDFGIDAEHGPFLVMEYLEGISLREKLQGDGPLPLTAAVQISPLADVLDLDSHLNQIDDPFIGAALFNGRVMPNELPGLGVRRVEENA